MAVTQFIWDPLSDNVLEEMDDVGDSQAVYTNEPDEFDNLVSQRRDISTSYYHFDAIGSTRELTNTAETVTDTNLYDAWGIGVVSSGDTVNAFEWVGGRGYQSDHDSASYYVRRRVYSPVQARWLCKDDIWEDGTNLFQYGRNQPTQIVDPTGRKCQIGVHCWDVKRFFGWIKLGEHCGLTINSDIHPFRGGDVWLDGLPDKHNCLRLLAAPPPTVIGEPLPPNYWEQETLTEFSDSTCRCLARQKEKWDQKCVKYSAINDSGGINSNCSLNCIAAECGIKLTWGEKPIGFDCNYCAQEEVDCDTGLPYCARWAKFDCKQLSAPREPIRRQFS